jgi:prophage antirepressor-like protein
MTELQIVNNPLIQDIDINNTLPSCAFKPKQALACEGSVRQGTVYDINNLLVTTFKNNNIQIFGTWDNPLFKANDIGALLGIKNIRDTISEFDDTQKRVSVQPTPSGQQEFNMLTEDGLYEVLFMSRKPVAKSFRKHVCDLLKQQRLELGKQLAIQHKIELAIQRQQYLLTKDNLLDKAGTYTLVDPIRNLGKYGNGSNLWKRVGKQLKNFKGFYLDFFCYSSNCVKLENTFRKYNQGERIEEGTEIIDFNTHDKEMIYNEVKESSKLIGYDESNELEHKRLDIKKLELEIELAKLRQEPMKEKGNELQIRIKRVLLDNFEVGGPKDYVKLKDIKLVLKNGGVKENDIISIIKIVLDTFEESEFKEKSTVNNKFLRNYFLKLKLS